MRRRLARHQTSVVVPSPPPPPQSIPRGVIEAFGVLAGLGTLMFLVGSAIFAARLRILGVSSSVLAASEIPRNDTLALGLKDVLLNAPFGLLSYVIVILVRRKRPPGLSRRARVVSAGLALAASVCCLLVSNRWWMAAALAAAIATAWLALIPAPKWVLPVVAIAVTAALAIATEADRTQIPDLERAVVILAPGTDVHRTIGDSFPLSYDSPDDPCATEAAPHICGLLINDGGSTVTLATLAAHPPKLLELNRSDIAGIVEYPAKAVVVPVVARYRKRTVGCRLPLVPTCQ